MRKSWLLAPIAFSAFVATWGGWVTMARMTGYGTVNLLPGIVGDDGWSTVDLAISLPMGVEAYGALALAVAFDQHATRGARWFGGLSAALSLTLAGTGQAIVHNLSAEGRTVAPAGVVSFVSVLPVLVLGMASVLAVLSQPRISAASRTASRWAGMLGRIAEAATDRAVSQLTHPAGTSQLDAETSQRDERNVPEMPIPVSPPPSGPDIPAGQDATERPVPIPQVPRTPSQVALEKRPEVVEQVAGMLAETPAPTVEKIAERLGTSRSSAGRVVKAARERIAALPQEEGGPPAADPINGQVPQLEPV